MNWKFWEWKFLSSNTLKLLLDLNSFNRELLSDVKQFHQENLKLLSQVQEFQRKCVIKNEHEIQQTLGQALGFPWYKDDQENFPGATEADGVCVGDDVAATLADRVAERIIDLEADVKRLMMERDAITRACWLSPASYADPESYAAKFLVMIKLPLCMSTWYDTEVEAINAVRKAAGLEPEPIPQPTENPANESF